MVAVDDLVEFLRAQLAKDEQWALAASKPYEHADGNPTVPKGGVHWEWVVGENWEPAQPNPVEDEFVADPGYSCNLATTERWKASYGAGLRSREARRTYAHEIIEMDAAAAGHIARHDPARVLAEVEAKRQVIEEYEARVRSVGEGLAVSQRRIVQLLALPYAGHGDYRKEWRP